MKQLYKRIILLMHSIALTVQTPKSFIMQKFERRSVMRETMEEANNIDTKDFNKGTIEPAITSTVPTSNHEDRSESKEENIDSLFQPMNNESRSEAKEEDVDSLFQPMNNESGSEAKEEDIDSLFQPMNDDSGSEAKEEDIDSLFQPMNKLTEDNAEEIDEDGVDVDTIFTPESNLSDESDENNDSEEHTYTVVRLGDISSDDDKSNYVTKETNENIQSEDKKKNNDAGGLSDLFGSTTKDDELSQREIFIASLPTITVQELLDDAADLTAIMGRWKQS